VLIKIIKIIAFFQLLFVVYTAIEWIKYKLKYRKEVEVKKLDTVGRVDELERIHEVRQFRIYF
jgi:hypothetical protein